MTLRIPLAKSSYATLSAYAPTLPSDNSVKDSFYQLLDDSLHCVNRNDRIFILGSVGGNSNLCRGVMARHRVWQVNA